MGRKRDEGFKYKVLQVPDTKSKFAKLVVSISTLLFWDDVEKDAFSLPMLGISSSLTFFRTAPNE